MQRIEVAKKLYDYKLTTSVYNNEFKNVTHEDKYVATTVLLEIFEALNEVQEWKIWKRKSTNLDKFFEEIADVIIFGVHGLKLEEIEDLLCMEPSGDYPNVNDSMDELVPYHVNKLLNDISHSCDMYVTQQFLAELISRMYNIYNVIMPVGQPRPSFMSRLCYAIDEKVSKNLTRNDHKNNKQSEVIVVIGNRGSGKSTFSRRFVDKSKDQYKLESVMTSGKEISNEIANWGAQYAEEGLQLEDQRYLWQEVLPMIRELEPNIWINSLTNRMEDSKNYIIDDVRYINELNKLKPTMVIKMLGGEYGHETDGDIKDARKWCTENDVHYIELDNSDFIEELSLDNSYELVGCAGSGKSTMLPLFEKLGFEILEDDLVLRDDLLTNKNLVEIQNYVMCHYKKRYANSKRQGIVYDAGIVTCNAYTKAAFGNDININEHPNLLVPADYVSNVKTIGILKPNCEIKDNIIMRFRRYEVEDIDGTMNYIGKVNEHMKSINFDIKIGE